MYIIKTKGTGKIPDFIQLRDSDFVLINHFIASRPENVLKKLNLEDKTDKIKELISQIEYGEVRKLDI